MFRSFGPLVLFVVVVSAPLPGSAAGSAAGAEWDGRGLPPAIAKPRPSAGVPADMPGSKVEGCEVLRNLTIYTPAGRRAIVGIKPSDVASPQQLGCLDGSPPEGGSPATGPDAAPPE